MPEEVEPTFESAVGQLEEIVEALERGEPELTTALAKYEVGVRLLNQCYGLLERAERSVALLTGVDEQGKPSTLPFDASATATLAREAQRSTGSGASGEEPAAPKPSRARRARPAPPPLDDPSDPPF
jgi:exodeoxyribonuclease VII small subunit